MTREAPCVVVPREDGESTRRRLADRGLLDERYAIQSGEEIAIPVADPRAVERALGETDGDDADDDRIGGEDRGDESAGADGDGDGDDRSGASVDYRIERRAVERRDDQTTPEDLLEFSPTYERLGDLALLRESPDRADRAAEAIVASDLPVDAVLNATSEVQGDLRVREWDLLAGEDGETVHREHGYEYLLDVRAVYFSPRLATERHRVTRQIGPDERVADMFAGVGPFAVPAADRGESALAVDRNERAVEYLRENARRNGVADDLTAVAGDVRTVAPDHAGEADRVVMNLPHSADQFLGAATTLAGEDCLVHYYDIQADDDPFGPGEAALRQAAEAAGYDLTIEDRREVRSYAPHEVNVRIDARLRR